MAVVFVVFATLNIDLELDRAGSGAGIVGDVDGFSGAGRGELPCTAAGCFVLLVGGFVFVVVSRVLVVVRRELVVALRVFLTVHSSLVTVHRVFLIVGRVLVVVRRVLAVVGRVSGVVGRVLVVVRRVSGVVGRVLVVVRRELIVALWVFLTVHVLLVTRHLSPVTRNDPQPQKKARKHGLLARSFTKAEETRYIFPRRPKTPVRSRHPEANK